MIQKMKFIFAAVLGLGMLSSSSWGSVAATEGASFDFLVIRNGVTETADDVKVFRELNRGEERAPKETAVVMFYLLDGNDRRSKLRMVLAPDSNVFESYEDRAPRKSLVTAPREIIPVGRSRPYLYYGYFADDSIAVERLPFVESFTNDLLMDIEKNLRKRVVGDTPSEA